MTEHEPPFALGPSTRLLDGEIQQFNVRVPKSILQIVPRMIEAARGDDTVLPNGHLVAALLYAHRNHTPQELQQLLEQYRQATTFDLLDPGPPAGSSDALTGEN